MNTLLQAAKDQANAFGFLVTETIEHDIFERCDVLVCKVDRIGPPAMMHAYSPSPFNDRLVSGNWAEFIKWVANLTAHHYYQS